MLTRWSEAENHYESLAVCLRAILAAHDIDVAYEELTATLGLGAAVVATDYDELGWWATYARDATLIATAERFGVQLRELHPPEAAVGLAESSEYGRHFQDSYVPLIREALEQGQPVLAWRGWPPPRDRLWGVLVEQTDDMLLGLTLWHGGRPLPLIGPAHQVYIVERVTRTPEQAFGPAEQFVYAAEQAIDMWHGKWGRAAGVVTGAAAYDRWCQALSDASQRSVRGMSLPRQHSQLVRVFVSARRYLATWLRSIASGLRAEHVELAAHWAAACDQSAATLADHEVSECVEQIMGRSGAECVCRTLEEVRRTEQVAIQKLEDQLAARGGPAE